MRECDAEIPQHSRIRQITLPARNRQLVGEMPQQHIGDAEIAFGVFKINRIDLVRHGR